jgi:hypothetical protein
MLLPLLVVSTVRRRIGGHSPITSADVLPSYQTTLLTAERTTESRTVSAGR